MGNLILVALTILTLNGQVLAEHKPDDIYRKTRKLLSGADVTHPNKEFARLYKIGDERIADLIRALKDEDREVCRRAQIVIRYLANPEGMRALHDTYAKQGELMFAGTVPVPLDDWDYQFIRSFFLEQPQKRRFQPAERVAGVKNY
jgi:hypothetical protein